MTASTKSADRKDRPNTPREADAATRKGRNAGDDRHDYTAPSAGAHAADHLINDEATPGSGALPSHAHRSGKEVDGGAG